MTEKSFEVRDMRVKEKFVLDDKYLNGWARKCGVYASAFYMSLCRHADKEQSCWPSLKKIAEEHNMSIKQAGRASKILESYRIIQIERLGKKLNNRYYLLDKSEWTDSPISERTDSPITMDSQSNHIGTDSPFHSKDTHIKDTQRKVADKKSAHAEIMGFYSNLVSKKFGFKPKIDAADGKGLKSALSMGVPSLKALIEWYLDSDKCRKLEQVSLSACLSKDSVNKWQLQKNSFGWRDRPELKVWQPK